MNQPVSLYEKITNSYNQYKPYFKTAILHSVKVFILMFELLYIREKILEDISYRCLLEICHL